MTDKILSQLQKEYRYFFLEKLKKFGVNSPAELTKTGKSEFFTSIKEDWAEIKIAKKQPKKSFTTQLILNIENSNNTFNEQFTKKLEVKKQDKVNEPKHNTDNISSTGGIQYQRKPSIEQDITKQIIKSEPNEEQTSDLKILYNPNDYFSQDENYCYPVVKMPNANSLLKLPRLGRTNQKGYKEKDFFNKLKHQIKDIEISDNVHMVIPNFSKPYEPDIVLFDKKHNLYIDIEIDEPYDGFYRHPTHCIKQQPQEADTLVTAKKILKHDYTRDLFFTESGWIVIRFTEKQVHCQSNECIDYIRNVINSINNRNFDTHANCEIEEQWDENQCIQWQKNNYRENYLGIDRFYKKENYKEIEIDIEIEEEIEKEINREKIFNFEKGKGDIAFDEETHKYVHAKDETGNAEYISVTTLIERFFPFDLFKTIKKNCIEKK